jgi:hypothetical protein
VGINDFKNSVNAVLAHWADAKHRATAFVDEGIQYVL